MSFYEYWIGKGINLRQLWEDYEQGTGYIDKYRGMDVHLVQFTFKDPPVSLPLFNLEVVLKTMKAYFHEIKVLSLSQEEYNEAGPLFVYEINRGSAIWSFLASLRHLVLFGTTLADEQLKNLMFDNELKKLEIVDKKIKVLRKHFGDSINPEDFRNFLAANKEPGLQIAVNKLLSQGIEKVEISKEPFLGDINATKKSLIDIKKELK
jgi:hypothetical protein